MKQIIKHTVKFIIIALFIGLLQIINNGFINGNFFTTIFSIRITDLISASLIFIFILFLIRYASVIGSGIKSYNKFLSRIFKILIWLIAFIIIFNNDNLHNALIQLINGLLSEIGVYVTRSAIGNYISTFEIILISIPLIRFFIYFFQNLDGYIELFFKRSDKKKEVSIELEKSSTDQDKLDTNSNKEDESSTK
tara:strand:- start:919 stop:1500 length:582 start_codon:yes stop_codon:yes gene_type:complete